MCFTFDLSIALEIIQFYFKFFVLKMICCSFILLVTENTLNSDLLVWFLWILFCFNFNEYFQRKRWLESECSFFCYCSSQTMVVLSMTILWFCVVANIFCVLSFWTKCGLNIEPWTNFLTLGVIERIFISKIWSNIEFKSWLVSISCFFFVCYLNVCIYHAIAVFWLEETKKLQKWLISNLLVTSVKMKSLNLSKVIPVQCVKYERKKLFRLWSPQCEFK